MHSLQLLSGSLRDRHNGSTRTNRAWIEPSLRHWNDASFIYPVCSLRHPKCHSRSFKLRWTLWKTALEELRNDGLRFVALSDCDTVFETPRPFKTSRCILHDPYLLTLPCGQQMSKNPGNLGLCISEMMYFPSRITCFLCSLLWASDFLPRLKFKKLKWEGSRVHKTLVFTVIRQVSHLKNVAEEIDISYVYIYIFFCFFFSIFSTCGTTPPYLSSYHLYFALWGMLRKKLQHPHDFSERACLLKQPFWNHEITNGIEKGLRDRGSDPENSRPSSASFQGPSCNWETQTWNLKIRLTNWHPIDWNGMKFVQLCLV